MAKNNSELAAKVGVQQPSTQTKTTQAATTAAKQPTVIDTVRAYFKAPAVAAEIKATLPHDITPEHLVRTAVSQIRQNPTLLSCSIESLCSSIIRAAEEGLDFALGHAYLVPFRVKKKLPDDREMWVDECTYIRGYQGLLKLCRNSGEIVDVQAHIVFRNDVFQIVRGYEEDLKHIPDVLNPGEAVGVYMKYVLKSGGRGCEFMTVADVEKIRAISKQPNGLMWRDNWNEAARKTVLRRGLKYLPKSKDLAKVLEREEFDEGFISEVAGATGIELNLGETGLPQSPPTKSLPEPAAEPTIDTSTAQREEPPVTANEQDATKKGSGQKKASSAKQTPAGGDTAQKAASAKSAPDKGGEDSSGGSNGNAGLSVSEAQADAAAGSSAPQAPAQSGAVSADSWGDYAIGSMESDLYRTPLKSKAVNFWMDLPHNEVEWDKLRNVDKEAVQNYVAEVTAQR